MVLQYFILCLAISPSLDHFTGLNSCQFAFIIQHFSLYFIRPVWLLEKPRPICIWGLGGRGVLPLWTIAEFPLYVMSVISTRMGFWGLWHGVHGISIDLNEKHPP